MDNLIRLSPPPKAGGLALRICAVVFLVLILPLIAGAAEVNKQILYQQVRSASILVSTHALIYYGAEQPGSDPRSLDAYKKNLQQLNSLAEALGQPPSLQAPIAKMTALFPQLENLAGNRYGSYSDLLIGVLDADADIKKAVFTAYAQPAPQLPQTSALLRELSERLGDLLIANQARATRVMGEYSVAYEVGDAEVTDKRIGELFAQLKQQLPDQEQVLNEQERIFRFARGQLLGSTFKSVSGSTAFYLGKVIAKIDGLAASIRT